VRFRSASLFTRLAGSLRFGASSWSVGSIWDKSGPPSFAHECRRRMPRRSVATCRAIARSAMAEARRRRASRVDERASARQAARRMPRRSGIAAKAGRNRRLLGCDRSQKPATIPPIGRKSLRLSAASIAQPGVQNHHPLDHAATRPIDWKRRLRLSGWPMAS
jgi:hypothetical protein